jgi:hypothetical protein
MNRVALAAAVAFGLATGAPGAARPLTFGAINGTDDLSQSSDLGGCASAPEIGSGAQTCALKRKAFGELSVSRGTVSLDAMGRARSVVIGLSARDYDRALQLLIGRYGRSVFEGGAAVWRGYDARAQIALQRSASGVQVRFDYPANGAVASTTPDPRLAASLLAFIALGLAAGYAVRAVRKPPAPEPSLSMRATLERKIREGADFQV